MKRNRAFLAAGTTAMLCLGVAPAVADGAQTTASHPLNVIATGLNNPKHLAFGPDGRLYVPESGLGDPTKKNCVSMPGDSGDTTKGCVGKTAAVVWISRSHAIPVVTGLESVQEQDSGETLGPAAVTFNHGQLSVVMQDVDIRPDGTNGLLGGDEFGKVVLASKGSSRSSFILGPDFAAYAAEHPQTDQGGSPGELAYDSDPYDITPYHGGYAVVDAAANSLRWISPTGQISTLAKFPTLTETAPAGTLAPVAVGPDGALYVGELRGVPSLPGTANVYRVVPGQAPTVYASGFSAITDLAFDPQGNLLVLELSVGGLLSPPTVPGALIRVSNNRSHTRTVLASAGLSHPTGLAVNGNGTIYVANNGTAPGTGAQTGEIVRIN